VEFSADERGNNELRVRGRLGDPTLAFLPGTRRLGRWVRACDLQIDDLRWANGRMVDCMLSGTFEAADLLGGTGRFHVTELSISGRRIRRLLLTPDRVSRIRGVHLDALSRTLGLGPAGGRIDLILSALTVSAGRLEAMELEIRSTRGTDPAARFLGQALMERILAATSKEPVLLPLTGGKVPYDQIGVRIRISDGQVRFWGLFGFESRSMMNLQGPFGLTLYSLRQQHDPPAPIPLARFMETLRATLDGSRLPEAVRGLLGGTADPSTQAAP
jgi:hypothetical protein